MKRFVSGLFLIMVAAVAIACGQPKLEIIGGDTYDWGEVKTKDAPLKAKVQLKNTGDKLLEITDVKTSCGCTTAPLDKNKLQPGETATLSINFNPGSSSGLHQKSVRIASNDPNKPEAFLTVKATIVKTIEVGPQSYFAYNEMKVGQRATSTVKIKNTSKKNITLKFVSMEPQEVEVNFQGAKTLKPNEEFELKSWVTPNKTGYFNSSLTLETDDEDNPKLIIPGYGSVSASTMFNENK